MAATERQQPGAHVLLKQPPMAHVQPAWGARQERDSGRPETACWRYPKLRVVGCHLGSDEDDLARLARRLDAYPNFAVDTAARVRYFARGDRDQARQFLTHYQDRVLYATDFSFRDGDPKPRQGLCKPRTTATGTSSPGATRWITPGVPRGAWPSRTTSFERSFATTHDAGCQASVPEGGIVMAAPPAPDPLSLEQVLEAVDHLSPAQIRELERRLAARRAGNRNEGSDEATLVRAATAQLPAATERRLKRLIARSERGKLTRNELAEYQALAQEVQRLDVARAEALAELVPPREIGAGREGGNRLRRQFGWRMRRSRGRSDDRCATAPATAASTAGIPRAIRAPCSSVSTSCPGRPVRGAQWPSWPGPARRATATSTPRRDREIRKPGDPSPCSTRAVRFGRATSSGARTSCISGDAPPRAVRPWRRYT